jgi:hypothetical protein
LISGAKVQKLSFKRKENSENLSLEGKERAKFLSLKDIINDKRQ